MLPPATRCAGALAQRVPLSSVICAATPSSDSIDLAGRGRLSGGQLREPLALAAQERAETEPVVQLAEARQIRQAPPQTLGRHAEVQIAGDARQAPREIHALAMLDEARAETRRAAQLEVRDTAEVAVKLF